MNRDHVKMSWSAHKLIDLLDNKIDIESCNSKLIQTTIDGRKKDQEEDHPLTCDTLQIPSKKYQQIDHLESKPN